MKEYYCRHCGGEAKQANSFTCNACANLYNKYRIRNSDRLAMMQDQDNQCAICTVTFDLTAPQTTVYPVVDHCHDTDKIRGLLCSPCNQAIGLLRESPRIMQNAINYVRKHNESKLHRRHT